MGLLIACMIVYGLKLPAFLYVAATALWVMKLIADQ